MICKETVCEHETQKEKKKHSKAELREAPPQIMIIYVKPHGGKKNHLLIMTHFNISIY